jgi:hypothetical protein
MARYLVKNRNIFTFTLVEVSENEAAVVNCKLNLN